MSDTEEVPAEEAQEEQGEEQDEVTTTFKQYAREEEGLMKTSAYTALCCLGHNPSVLDVNKFYEEKSKGEDEGISEEEFRELVGTMGDPEAQLEEAFRHFAGEDNFLDREELRKIIVAVNEFTGEEGCEIDETIEEVFTKCDLNGDGMLDLEELKKAICDKDLLIGQAQPPAE